MGMEDATLGRVVNTDTGEEFETITVVPISRSDSRAYWDKNSLQCASDDGIKGSEYGDCDGCKFRNKCTASEVYIGLINGAPGMVGIRLKPARRIMDRPKNWMLSKQLTAALLHNAPGEDAEAPAEHKQVTLNAVRQSNKNKTIAWTDWHLGATEDVKATKIEIEGL